MIEAFCAAWVRVLVCVGLTFLAIAQSANAQPIPLEARESVGYVMMPGPKWNPKTKDFERTADGDVVLELKHIGTAFGARFTWRNGETRDFIVTAKHVVIDLRTRQQQRPLFLRWMTPHKKAEVFPLDEIEWLTHSDPGVDIAVLPGVLTEAFNRTIQSELWLTDELIRERGIDVGDEVFYTGLLFQLPGQKALAPIVRFGRLALVTDERLQSEEVPEGSLLHFLDAANMPGHSGSPVFLWATPTRTPNTFVFGNRILRLYGVVSNLLTYPVPVQETAGTRGIVSSSGGVTGVVPVRYLREILESESAREVFKIGKATAPSKAKRRPAGSKK